MATAATDPTKLASSSQIFSSNHTLPQIRAIHKTLHAEIEDKASRLRAQVGSSYRDLLGTADTIVQMRADSDAVQELLGKMGWRCGRTVVSAKTHALSKMTTGAREAGAVGVAEAARRKMLDGCFLAVDRALKGVDSGERLVLATKVLVLARLLVNSMGDGAETARKTLDSLRRRLRRALEKAAAKVGEGADRENLLKALCAHGLVSSSGAKDVLRHFLDVRSKAIVLALEEEVAAEAVVHALRIYTRTLLDVQALVPGKLSQALRGLAEKPLLEDASLRRLEGLRLDVCERWCGEEIKYFTPFIRHDDLEAEQAREALGSWAEKEKEALLASMDKALTEMTDFKPVMDLRTDLLKLWIRESGKVRGIDAQEMQDSMRNVVNARMLAVLEDKVRGLDAVGSRVKETLETWQPGVTGKTRSLWDEDGYDEALSRGAAPFIQEVAFRFHGWSEAVSSAVDCYRSWFRIIGVAEDVVAVLRKQRWDNDYDEIEDEETIEARQQLLSKDDPKMLQDKLDEALDQSFAKLEGDIKGMWEQQKADDGIGGIAMYLVRVLRDVRRQLPKRDAMTGFGLVMVPSLHERMAASVAAPATGRFTTGLSQRSVTARALWEGDPALPTQPSLEVFQLLHGLSSAMADAGADLWTAAAAAVLKKHVGEQLCEAWTKKLENTEDAEVCTQWLFDVSLLRCCVASEGLEKLEEEAFEKSGLEGPSRQRIGKSARAFWDRTSLLFGLLS